MKHCLVFALLMLAVPAMAQPVSDQAVNEFVDSHAAVTHLGKIARWEDPVCPQVNGLPANFTKFIAKRVREVAAQVGAPVDPDETNCKSNIEIVFTATPQDLLNSIREKQPIYLGYYDNSGQADEIAKVKHVIQAWHATQQVDLRGNKMVESNNPTRPNGRDLNLTASDGRRTGDGVRSTYYRGVIVADPNKLGDYEIGTLADHIAMLALAQPASLDVCQEELPSILDMTNPTCRKDKPVKALTKADTGYLQGLYKTLQTGASLRLQKDSIAYQIKQNLGSQP
jgi:hypothetical protein